MSHHFCLSVGSGRLDSFLIDRVYRKGLVLLPRLSTDVARHPLVPSAALSILLSLMLIPALQRAWLGVRHWPLPVQTLQHLERPVEGTLATGREDKVWEALRTSELLSLWSPASLSPPSSAAGTSRGWFELITQAFHARPVHGGSAKKIIFSFQPHYKSPPPSVFVPNKNHFYRTMCWVSQCKMWISLSTNID